MPARSVEAARPCSPRPGGSTLITSAPSQASVSVHDGPASNCVTSTTRTPLRAAPSIPLPPGLSWPASPPTVRRFAAPGKPRRREPAGLYAARRWAGEPATPTATVTVSLALTLFDVRYWRLNVQLATLVPGLYVEGMGTCIST